jgi:hypothetical protein
MGITHRRRKKPMDENISIQLFEDRKIRTAWDEERESCKQKSIAETKKVPPNLRD